MKRNEIWWINLDPTVGQEIQKTRPCIVVNDDSVGILPLRVVVAITLLEWIKLFFGRKNWIFDGIGLTLAEILVVIEILLQVEEIDKGKLWE
ncbi:MAG: type II toxin-antitoxin system PemK/MazF family toxin [Saprospiraceae bacterium]|nr:type II toxin-antitoxin system PemK/MazF family toxin [Saprospiraceae bacterium]